MLSVISEQFDFSRLFTTCSDEKLLLQFLLYALLGGISRYLWHLDLHTCHVHSFQMCFSRKFLIHKATSRLQLPDWEASLWHYFPGGLFPNNFTHLTRSPYCCSHQHVLEGLRAIFEAFSAVITTYVALASLIT